MGASRSSFDNAKCVEVISPSTIWPNRHRMVFQNTTVGFLSELDSHRQKIWDNNYPHPVWCIGCWRRSRSGGGGVIDDPHRQTPVYLAGWSRHLIYSLKQKRIVQLYEGTKVKTQEKRINPRLNILHCNSLGILISGRYFRKLLPVPSCTISTISFGLLPWQKNETPQPSAVGNQYDERTRSGTRARESGIVYYVLG